MSISGTSQFKDIKNVVYSSATPVTIYSVMGGITVSRKSTYVEGHDNNRQQMASRGLVGWRCTGSFETEDLNAAEALSVLNGPPSGSGAHNLTFTAIPQEDNIASTTPLVAQAVTIANVIIDDVDLSFQAKAIQKYRVTFTCMGNAGDTDPVTYATGS